VAAGELLADLEDLIDSLSKMQDILASLSEVFAAKRAAVAMLRNCRCGD